MTVILPDLTVVMPVFNAMPYLDEAIESILKQTFSAFQFVIYDDHSTDGSYDCALGWAVQDPRIRVYRSEHRLGPRTSSQAAAELANSEYVARMDADDVAQPERLELQISVLRENSQAVLIGSTADIIDASGQMVRHARAARVDGSVPPFAHPSIMYRNKAFAKAGGYRTGTEYFEDLDLYLRLAQVGQLLVINQPLVKMRYAGQNARLRDNPLEVLRQVDRRNPESAVRSTFTRSISPMTFYSIAVLSILANERPRLLQLMAKHCYFMPFTTAIVAFGMIAIAEISPLSARKIGFFLNALSNGWKYKSLSRGAIYIWNAPTLISKSPSARVGRFLTNNIGRRAANVFKAAARAKNFNARPH